MGRPEPISTGAPGRTVWTKAIAAKASASISAVPPAIVTGAIAPSMAPGMMMPA